jgi:hypothetical protein
MGSVFPFGRKQCTFNGTVRLLKVKLIHERLKIKSGYPFLMNILEITENE